MKREIWIDWLRIIACFGVMLTHSVEPFYLGGEGSLILTKADAFWVGFLNVLPRACVALFVVASSYLQFPLHYSTAEFFKRRAVRILIPFAVWSVVYALVWGEPVQNFRDLLLNFNYAAGHMWFVYMLIGLYLLMPLLSPWAEKVGKRELQVYLGIWLFTTVIPLIRQLVGGPAPVIYGPSGIPNAALYPLWGEASWNAYGVFYYLSGFVGYMLLGLYFRKFVGSLSWGRTLAVALPSFLAGLAICSGGFLSRVWADCGGSFPVEGPVGLAALWEGPWLNDTLGVALMTIAWILVLRKIGSGSAVDVSGAGAFTRRVVVPVSQAGYGMYLSHLLLLGLVSGWLRSTLGLGAEGVLGPVWTTPTQILLTAVISFVSVALICVLIRRIPRVGKWIMG
ncbi:MAG: acyltransferase [Bacteroidales bacterium]|nr:acyltransferase [Bacteroidales bacterium]